MTEPRPKRPRTTPRNSATNELELEETPFSTLRKLAAVAPKHTTPQTRRTPTAGPPSTGRHINRTPRIGPRQTARRGPPTTPHALKALEARRNAALTPGRDRRRSGRMQRATPRDVLRNLSRLLARNTATIEPSPQLHGIQHVRSGMLDDEDEEEDHPPAPRLSMPFNDLSDDDSFHVKPPRLSLALNDEDITTRSLEANRRATADTIPRFSLGSTRLSERFADLNELGIDAASILDEAGNVTVDDETARDLLEQAGFDVDVLLEEDTRDEQAFAEALRRGGRQSNLGVGAGAGAGAGQEVEDDTFRFVVPDRARFVREQREAEEEEDARAEEEVEEEQIVPADELDDAEGEGELDEEAADAEDAQERTLREDSITAAERPQADPLKPTGKPGKRKRKELKLSKHGIEYPSLPPTVVKRLATTFLRSAGNGNAKINKETLDAIVQTSDWFFEQIGEDLESYADHAGRRTIDEGDVVTLMKRQRLLNANTTPFSLAQKFLPRELLQEIRMPTPAKSKKAKKRRMETIDEEESVG